MFDLSFFVIAALFLALAAAAWYTGGAAKVAEGAGAGLALLWRYGLLLVLAFMAAGLAQTLLPREAVTAALGEGAGLRGLLLAALAGIITPSGPFVSLPIAATLYGAGASAGAVVAYLTAWALLAAHRFFAWELPLLGFRFAAFRWLLCLALPLLAGLAAQFLKRWALR